MTDDHRSGDGPEGFGPYELRRLIGRGGAGEVYEAYDRVAQRVVALKLLAAHHAEDTQYRARFQREARLAARLRDPHVIPIHTYGEIDGRLYLDMRLVEGADLEQVVAREGPLSPARAVAVLGQVAGALGAAHAEGLIHRDVKPSNVLVTRAHDGQEFAYLADFGITRTTDPGSTCLTTGMIVGTADYMAPEQCRGEAEARSDVYSLGCVLFRCLTGSVPFPDRDLPAVLSAHLWEDPPRISDRAPHLGTHLDDVVATAMAKSPEDRHPDPVTFAQAARRAVDGAGGPPAPTTSIRPHGPADRSPVRATAGGTTSFADRRRARMVGVAVATALVLLTGVVAVLLATTRPSQGAPAPVAGPPVSTALPRVVSTLAVPGRPETVAVGRDGSRAYMTTSDPRAPALHVVDTAANRLVRSVPLPGIPRFVAVSPATGNVYVSYNDRASDRLMLAGYDVTLQRIVKNVPTGQPQDRKTGQTWLFVMAISPDGKRVYVPHHTRSVVSVVDTDRNVPVAQIPMPRNPHSVAIAPDQRRAWVTAHASGEVDVIDLATNAFTGSVPIGPGTSPHDVDVSADGRQVQVANFDAGTVSWVDVATNRVAGTIGIGGKPQSIVFAPDGRRSYVVDNAGDAVSTIDSATHQVTGSVRVNRGASMIALSPDGTRAYVASRESGTITTLLTAS
ncbi:MAG: serine/threonine-protein kinase [Pseudonocardia sediminis]